MNGLYEVVTLDVALWAAREVLPRLEAYFAQGSQCGEMLGCWEMDIGVQQRLVLLRRFPELGALSAERQKLLTSADPFDAGRWLKQMKLETYLSFPFMPPVEPAAQNSVYEFRYYDLVVGGLSPTLAAWEATLPKRTPVSPVMAGMYALDGIPRILHIISYTDLDARRDVRAQLYREGRWPPPGAPEQVRAAHAEIGYSKRIFAAG